MRDTRARLTRGTASAKPTRSWLVVLVTVVIATGLSAATGGAVATSHQPDHEPLVITGECTDGTSTVTLTNPNDETVETTMSWDGDQSAIHIYTERESTIESDVGTTSLELATHLSTESLTVAVPADESVTIEGLADDTYELSADADGANVSVELDELALEADELTLEDEELTVDCGAETNDGSGTLLSGPISTSPSADQQTDETLGTVDEGSGG